MHLRTALAATGLTVVLALGGATAASAADTTTASSSPTRPAPTAEQIAERCAKVPALLERLSSAQDKAATTLTRLQEALAKAQAEGKERRVERLTKAIAKVETRIERLATAEAKVQSWAEANCDEPAA